MTRITSLLARTPSFYSLLRTSRSTSAFSTHRYLTTPSWTYPPQKPKRSSGLKYAAVTVVGAGLVWGGYQIYNSSRDSTSKDSDSKPTEDQENEDDIPFTLLDNEEIDNRIRSGEALYIDRDNRKLKPVYVNRLASNDPVEDFYSVNSFNRHATIAGVYDGHLGPECASLLARYLPTYIAAYKIKSSIKHPKDKDAISLGMTAAFERLDADLIERVSNLLPSKVTLDNLTPEDVQAIWDKKKDAKTFLTEAISGSCACVVFVDGDDLWVANTGDSWATVGRQNSDGTWTAIRVASEQSPDNPDHRRVLISQHPPEEAEDIVKNSRILGLIGTGGAFGDIMYKLPPPALTTFLPNIPPPLSSRYSRWLGRLQEKFLTPPYLRALPNVVHHKLTLDDKFVVVGSDGLWWELGLGDAGEKPDQRAIDIVGSWYTDTGSNPAVNNTVAIEANAATHLLRAALLEDASIKTFSTDNTIVLSKRLTRTPSRDYRDDITVQVILLQDTVEGEGKKIEEVDLVNNRRIPGIEKKKKGWYQELKTHVELVLEEVNTEN